MSELSNSTGSRGLGNSANGISGTNGGNGTTSLALENIKGVSISAPESTLSGPTPIDYDITGQRENQLGEVKVTGSNSKYVPRDTLHNTPYLATEYTHIDGNYYNDSKEDDDDFSLPQWGYDNFILERANFQKSVSSLFNEPAFFYFKLFFKFNTGYGLLGPETFSTGSVMQDQQEDITPYNNSILEPRNSALTYLWNLIKNTKNYYGNSELPKRKEALEKFINILGYINRNCPWFFKSIRGLDKVESFIDLKTDDNIIEIGCMQEAIDMRLETLLGLYRYACYDAYNQREIIPENLRMFDMAVMVFQTPLRYYQTGIISRSTKKNFKYKSMHGFNSAFGENGNRMSFKIIFFKNCEILADSFKTILPGELTNERPTSLDNISIKIKYQRALVYNFNEFLQLFYGDVGNNLINIPVTLDNSRFKAIRQNLSKLYYYNPYATEYKDLIDACESVMRDGMRMTLPEFCMGNIYGTKYGVRSDYFKKKMEALNKGTILSGNLYGDATDPNSEYYQAKLERLKGKSVWGNLYGDTTNVNRDYFKAKMKELKEKSVSGNLYGTSTNIKSKYFIAKLKELRAKSTQGNLYGQLTSVYEKYYEEKLKYFNSSTKSEEEYLRKEEAYIEGAKRDIDLLFNRNDYSDLIESDDVKYSHQKEKLETKEQYIKATGKNIFSPVSQIDIKHLIKENGIKMDENKKSFWQQLLNQFWSGNDSLTDTIVNFDLKNLIKW